MRVRGYSRAACGGKLVSTFKAAVLFGEETLGTRTPARSFHLRCLISLPPERGLAPFLLAFISVTCTVTNACITFFSSERREPRGIKVPSCASDQPAHEFCFLVLCRCAVGDRR